jgi:hypothetical protein
LSLSEHVPKSFPRSWSCCGGIFDPEELRHRQSQYEAQLSSPEAWENPALLQQLSRQVAAVREELQLWEEALRRREDITALLELAEEAQDLSLTAELDAELDAFAKAVEALELRYLLSDPRRHTRCPADNPRRRRRNRSPGLGTDAPAHVHPLG